MKRLFYAVLIVLAVGVVGCAERGISVNASSEDRDIFQNPEGEKDGLSLLGPDEAAAPGRAPFVDLSTFSWEYAEWLASLRAVIADLRLPDSAETRVELHFRPGPDDPGPSVKIECALAPADCARLREQIDALTGFPALPADFPYPELVATLSRLP